jgi:hypothetical protein
LTAAVRSVAPAWPAGGSGWQRLPCCRSPSSRLPPARGLDRRGVSLQLAGAGAEALRGRSTGQPRSSRRPSRGSSPPGSSCCSGAATSRSARAGVVIGALAAGRRRCANHSRPSRAQRSSTRGTKSSAGCPRARGGVGVGAATGGRPGRCPRDVACGALRGGSPCYGQASLFSVGALSVASADSPLTRRWCPVQSDAR